MQSSQENRPADPERLSRAPKKSLDGVYILNTICIAAVVISFLHNRINHQLWLIISALVLGAVPLTIWHHWRQQRQLQQLAAKEHQPARTRSPVTAAGPSSSVTIRLKSNLEPYLLFMPLLALLLMAWELRTFDAKELKYLLILLALPIFTLLLMAYWAFRRRVWQWQCCGYDADHRAFFHEIHSYLSQRPQREEWSAEHFCGIYWEANKTWSRFGLCAVLWLAGKDGGQDQRLVELNLWFWDNYREAMRAATSLSEASGLPILYR